MSLTAAVMQPYAFPYVGYLSLVAASDVFVFYDDVAHQPRGWIHRNRILVGRRDRLFTIPLVAASQNRWIGETLLHEPQAFCARFTAQLKQAYRGAPFLEATLHYVAQVFEGTTAQSSVADLAIRSVQMACEHIGLRRRFLRSSTDFPHTRGLGRAERLIAIARELGATRYVNSPGGTALYTPAPFEQAGLQLRFVRALLAPYAQTGGGEFVPGLSLIDLFMHLPPEAVRREAERFELLQGEPA